MKQAANALYLIAALTVAESATANNRSSVDIKAGQLGDAIVQLGQQTGSSIGISDQRTTRLTVRAVRGRLSVEQAIRKLLKGQPARVIQINGRSWRIIPATLPSVAARPKPRPARIQLARFTPQPAIVESEPKEIVVTASKRETPLKLMPATVSMLRGDNFTAGPDAGSTAAILEKLPSVSSTHAGTGRNKLFIRGIADSGFTGPTQATVGQYFGEMRVNYNAPDPDLRLYDISSVEVLEGPQGTLYGAGSLGGIIRANPNRPNLGQTEAYASYALASTAKGDESVDGHMVVNVPLVPDKIAARIVAYGAREGGYVDDIGRGLKDVNGIDIVGGRGAISIVPHDDWRVDFLGVGQSVRSDDAQYAQRGLPGLSRRSPMAQMFGSDYWLANMQVTGRIGEVRVMSSVGIVEHDLVENYDATRLRDTPTLFTQKNDISLFSTEHRLSQDFASGGGGWMLGASYIKNVSRLTRTLTPATLSVPTPGVENRLSEWALFGEMTVGISQNIYVTAGGRFSSARLSGNAFDVPAMFDLNNLRQQAQRTETTFLPSFAVVATPAEGLTAFLRYQQGFRPGGLAIDGVNIRHFRNDRTSTIESGFRFGDLERDLFAAIGTIAYTDWDNIQADLTDGQGFPTTANIGNGYIVSVEGQVSVRPTDRFTFDGAFIFSHSRLDSPSAVTRYFLATSRPQTAGQMLSVPNVATFSSRATVHYRQPLYDDGYLVFAASSRYVGKSRLGIGPVLGAEQGGYFQTNVGLKWERSQSDFFLNISNVFNAVGNRYALGTPFALPDGDEYTPLRPRTVMVGFNFGL
jgi:iron complex outermembrane recepter protein